MAAVGIREGEGGKPRGARRPPRVKGPSVVMSLRGIGEDHEHGEGDLRSGMLLGC